MDEEECVRIKWDAVRKYTDSKKKKKTVVQQLNGTPNDKRDLDTVGSTDETSKQNDKSSDAIGFHTTHNNLTTVIEKEGRKDKDKVINSCTSIRKIKW